MYIPEKRKNRQITLFDFNQSCGMELDPNNEWIRLAHAIPWSRMETKYAAMFPSKTGHPATPFRMALGVLIIQKRKKLEVNEYILETSGVTKEHEPKNESKNAKAANTRSDDIENLGTEILDATCSPSNIRYPQDFSLLNEARGKLEDMIDYFHKNCHPWAKPRTYRRVKLYEQQKYMYENKTHSVEDRIVSISQPYLPPIVRGKAKSPVEFGVKYDVSIDEKGHARLEKLSFDAYNENTILVDAMNRYKERTGHYPKRVLVDQIYRTRSNRNFCKDHNITMSGPKLGRPSKDKKNTKEEYQDNTDRIEVERFFSAEKRCNGAGLIMTKLEETTLSSIAMSVLVTNLFAVDLTGIFLLYFSDNLSSEKAEHYIIIDDVV